MRVLLGFAAGTVAMSALTVILNLEPPAHPTPAVGRTPSAPPPVIIREACVPAAPAPTAAARREASERLPHDDHDLAATLPQRPFPDPLPVDAIDDEPGPEGALEPRAVPGARAERWPRFGLAAGIGAERGLTDGTADVDQLGVRVLVDPSRRIGLELGLEAARGRERTSTTVDGVVKWHLLPDRTLRPYGTIGVGWRHLTRPEAADRLTVPVGVGVAYRRRGWFADSRLTVRPELPDPRVSAGVSVYLGRAF